MDLGTWPITLLAMKILMAKKIASSCFTLGMKNETDHSMGMLCIS